MSRCAHIKGLLADTPRVHTWAWAGRQGSNPGRYMGAYHPSPPVIKGRGMMADKDNAMALSSVTLSVKMQAMSGSMVRTMDKYRQRYRHQRESAPIKGRMNMTKIPTPKMDNNSAAALMRMWQRLWTHGRVWMRRLKDVKP